MSVIDGKPSGKYSQEVDQQLAYSANLTDTQKVIAQYGEDPPGSETPPGHWNLFAQWVARRDHHSLDEDARMFFALNNALLDASITAWDAKRQWDSVRPITAVRWLKRGQLIQAWGGPYQGTKTTGGKDWLPYQPTNFPTPPFAEYLSGHSTFSGAGAVVLCRAWVGDLPLLAGLWVTARRRSGRWAGRRSGPRCLEDARQALTRPSARVPCPCPCQGSTA